MQDNTKRTLYLDTETTGLDASSGIVEIGIVDDAGETILQSFVNPWPNKTWPQAQAIHGISPEMVKHAPLIHDLWPIIFKLVQGSNLVIYNAAYDTQFFPNGRISCADIHCAMLRYGKVRGVVGHRGDYKWWKLVEAAAHCNHDWGQGKAHRAVADSLAARSVWHYCEQIESEKAQALAAANSGSAFS